MTTGGSKIARSPTMPTIDWKVDWSPISGMNCLGRLSRDSGQTRVPEPPHIITGRIFVIASSGRLLRRGADTLRDFLREGRAQDNRQFLLLPSRRSIAARHRR